MLDRLARQSLVAILFGVTAPAWAADARLQLEVGTNFIVPTSGAEHLKWGMRLDALVWPGEDWSPWISLDTGLGTFSAVNPGAQRTATSPEEEEVYTGSTPVLLRTLVRTPMASRTIRAVTGLTWYYADLSNPIVGSVPNAPTFGAVYSVGKQWETEIYAGLSLNPLGSKALLLLPEISTRRGLFRASFRIPIFRSLDQGITGVQPSVSIGLAVSL
jgi:hypothetical protein